jgi:hypothetical protein
VNGHRHYEARAPRETRHERVKWHSDGSGPAGLAFWLLLGRDASRELGAGSRGQSSQDGFLRESTATSLPKLRSRSCPLRFMVTVGCGRGLTGGIAITDVGRTSADACPNK